MKKLILLTLLATALALVGADCDKSVAEAERSPPKGTIELIASNKWPSGFDVYRFHDIERNEIRYIVFNNGSCAIGVSQ